MEPRRQEKDIGLPYSTMAYNPSSYNNESSTNVSTAPVVSNPADRRIRNEASRSAAFQCSSQTLDQHQHQHHQQNPPPPQQYINKDLNPDPDPAEVANAIISTASNSKTAAPQQLPPPAPAPAPAPVGNNSPSIRYRECLKNHAASKGEYVIDGCGEFMPSGEERTPEALRCAACDCHRNFHRKESDAETQAGTSSYHTHNHSRHNNTTHHTSLFRAQAQTPLITISHHHQQQQQQHKLSHGYSHGFSISPTGPMAPMMMAFGGNSGAAAESSSEDLNMFQYTAGGQAAQPSFSMSKKRFRTKFTQQQKDRMNEFAEKLGWKIQKQDEQEVQQFCNEVGVKRQVFKVWMHNNKQAMKKKNS